MKCDKCQGRGEHARNPNFQGGVYEGYISGAHETVLCKRCRASGYIGMELVRKILVEIAMQSSGRFPKLAQRALKEFDEVNVTQLTEPAEPGEG